MAATTDVPQCVVWGEGRRGRLGDGDGSYHCHSDVIPFNVGGANVAAADVGHYHTVVATEDGDVFVCGRNDSGQLGLGDNVDRLVPTAVRSLAGRHVVRVAAGYSFSVLLTSEHEVLTCGWNVCGELGLGDNNDRNEFSLVLGPLATARVVDVSAGGALVSAVSDEGKLYTWDYNGYGQLGLGHKNDQNSPQLVESMEQQGEVTQVS